MPSMTLTGIYRYPVKSLRGQGFAALDIDARGFEYDRRWMLVDGQGRFITQRQQARMALVSTAIEPDGTLCCEAPEMPPLRVGSPRGGRVEVRVWDDVLPAEDAGADAAAWFSDFLGVPCRLVDFADGVTRTVDPSYARAGDQVGFADGFPFLLISQASLDDLNGRLDSPIPMQRFRPNLVVDGCTAFAEDGWREIRIGDIGFRVAKPCSRCIIPTIDPDTAQRDAEPMRTLLGYRRRDNKVYFGQNLLHDRLGRLALGASVEVLA